MSDTGIVVFDFARFSARYPEFAALDPTLVGLYFNEATMFLDNTACSPAKDVGQREMLLFMLTAHIALLEKRATQGGGALVGPITSASEGSVSVSTSMQITSPTIAWYMQTPYGAGLLYGDPGVSHGALDTGRIPYLACAPGYFPPFGPFW